MAHCPQKYMFLGFEMKEKLDIGALYCLRNTQHVKIYCTLQAGNSTLYVLFNPDLILNLAILLNNKKKAVLSSLSLTQFHMCCTKNTNKRRKMEYTIKPSDVLCATCVQLQAITVLLL